MYTGGWTDWLLLLMRGYYWTGQRMILTDGWREERFGEVVEERRVAMEEGNRNMGLLVVGVEGGID